MRILYSNSAKTLYYNEWMRHVLTYLAAEPNGLATSWDPPTNFAKLENSPNWLKNPHRLWLENKIRHHIPAFWKLWTLTDTVLKVMNLRSLEVMVLEFLMVPRKTGFTLNAWMRHPETSWIRSKHLRCAAITLSLNLLPVDHPWQIGLKWCFTVNSLIHKLIYF